MRTQQDRRAAQRGAARRSSGPVVAAVAGLFLLLLSVPQLGPVIRAARADGTPGTFTAERLSCVRHPGHESCSWYGTFQPHDGHAGREDYHLYGSGRRSLHEGEQVSVIDVGREGRVYRPSGSREWIPTGLLLVAGLVLFVPLGRRVAAWRRCKDRGVQRSGTSSFTHEEPP